MRNARRLGSYLKELTLNNDISDQELAEVLHCDRIKVQQIFKGRVLLSYPQLESLSAALKVSMDDLLKGDPQYYERTVVHCMNPFSDGENREKILDYIDDYLDIKNALQ